MSEEIVDRPEDNTIKNDQTNQDTKGTLPPIFVVIILIFLVLISVGTIAEQESRLSLKSTLHNELNRINAEIAANPNPSDEYTIKTIQDSRNLRFDIRESLNVLSAIDSNGRDIVFDDQSVKSYGSSYRIIRASDYLEYIILQVISAFETKSNVVLFAASILCSAAIGASIASIRDHGRVPYRELFLGFGAGFIVFLAIKGGKFLFIVSAIGATAPLNPYGGAFAGLLAGMFTKRAYELLSMLVEDLFSRFESTMNSENGAPAAKVAVDDSQPTHNT